MLSQLTIFRPASGIQGNTAGDGRREEGGSRIEGEVGEEEEGREEGREEEKRKELRKIVALLEFFF